MCIRDSWYAFTASTGGPATIHAEPEGAQELVLCGLLMDAEGRVLSEAGGGAGGFVIDCELTAGARYYVRVSALDASTAVSYTHLDVYKRQGLDAQTLPSE